MLAVTSSVTQCAEKSVRMLDHDRRRRTSSVKWACLCYPPCLSSPRSRCGRVSARSSALMRPPNPTVIEGEPQKGEHAQRVSSPTRYTTSNAKGATVSMACWSDHIVSSLTSWQHD